MARQRLKNYELIIRGKLLPTLCSFAKSRFFGIYRNFVSKLNDLLDQRGLSKSGLIVELFQTVFI